jgi:uncharacterized delta-60 repeat protein
MTVLAKSGLRASYVGTVARHLCPVGMAISLAVSACSVLKLQAQTSGLPYAFTTIAGAAGQVGSVDAIGSQARFHTLFGVGADGAGNIYVADNSTVRKITPGGVVSTLAGLAGVAGSLDGAGTAARFGLLGGLTVDSLGNVYVTELASNTVRRLSAGGVVTTLAGVAGTQGSQDGPNSSARFSRPRGVAVDANGNVYVADSGNQTIRTISTNGAVSTLAGLAGSPGSVDGVGTEARFNNPLGLALDRTGNLYVADSYNETIRKITPQGVVTTVAGSAGDPGSVDGIGNRARFDYPTAVTVDSAGNICVADTGNYTIRQVTPNQVVTTLAGMAGEYGFDDGVGSSARFNFSTGITVDQAGNLYVIDERSQTLRKGFVGLGFGSPVFGGTKNAGFAEILVELGGHYVLPVTMDYATSDGTAIAGTDYVATNGTLVFAPGQTESVFNVQLISSNSSAAGGTINLTLSNPTGGASLNGPTNALLVITNDVFVSLSIFVTPEGDGSTYLAEVLRNGDTSTTRTLNYFTTDGPLPGCASCPAVAVAGVDYQPVQGILSFAPGETKKSFTIPILQKAPTNVVNQLVGFTVNLASGPNVISQAQATIDYNDFVRFAYPVYEVDETVGTVTLYVVRLGPTNEVTLSYFTSDGSPADPSCVGCPGAALAGVDYQAVQGTLTLGAGRTNAFTIPILDKGLSSSTNNSNSFVASLSYGSNVVSQARIIIHDNDHLTSGDISLVNEFDAAAIVTVVRNGGLNVPQTVSYFTTDGPPPATTCVGCWATAVAGLDYQQTTGTLNFAVGQSTNTVRIPILDRGLCCREATFTLNFLFGSNLVLQSQIIILDVDYFAFSPSNYDVNETDGSLTVSVTRGGGLNVPTTVFFYTTNGPPPGPGCSGCPAAGVAGVDYVATSGSISFGIGESNKTISIGIIDKGIIAGPNNTSVFGINCVYGSNLLSQAQITIHNNNQILFQNSFYDVNENDGALSVHVLRLGGTNIPSEVNYFTTDGPPSDPNCLGCTRAAIAGQDYVSTTGVLMFSGGQTNKSFAIPILDNGLLDGDRTFFVNLVYGSNQLAQSVITIHDNEIPSDVDFSFNPGPGVASQWFGGSVNALLIQPDGKVLIGGTFDTVGYVSQTNVARLNFDGSVDTNFLAGTSLTNAVGDAAQVSIVALQTNGQILIAGDFISVNGVNVNGLARLNPDGTLDKKFNSFSTVAASRTLTDQYGDLITPAIRALLVQPDGHIVIGGTFDRVNSVGRTNLARLNTNGSLDTNFVTGTDLIFEWFDNTGASYTNTASVSALALQLDGSLLVGGTFTMLGSFERNSIGRLTKNGTVDTNFFVGLGVLNDDNPGTVSYLAAQPDGFIILGGQFSSVHGQGHNNLARLNSDGSLDTSYSPNFTSARSTIGTSDADDEVFVDSTICGWGCSSELTRVNPDGSLENLMPPHRIGIVNALAVQSQNYLLVGGSFSGVTTFNGWVPEGGIARLFLDPSESVLQFTPTQDPNTSLYSGDISVSESDSYAVFTVQRSGDTSASLKVNFTTLDGTARAGINYVPTAGTLTIPSLQTSGNISVPLLRDGRVVGPLNFRIDLQNPSSGLLGLKTAFCVINDADLGFYPGQTTHNTNGQVTLGFNLPPSASSYTLQVSTDLQHWSTLTTYTGSGYNTFQEQPASNLKRRFYRLRRSQF